MAKESHVRLQVPVPGEIADQLSEAAAALEKPQAAVAVMLLEEAVRSRKDFTEWLATKLLEALLPGAPKRKASKRPEVRLELRVPVSLAKDIEALAARVDHTPVRMATLLLKAGLDENTGIIKVVTSSLVRKLRGQPERRTKESPKHTGD